jgi:lipoprotein-anchoring transpeptidase ErfK/SrfK/ribosomal protein L24E
VRSTFSPPGRFAPRKIATRVVALACVALMPIVVGVSVGTPAAGAAITGSDDTVFAFGSASFHGSTSHRHLNAPIVGMASTPSGKGYWLVADDGGIFTFNAPFFGSLGAIHLNSPIVGMAATPTGKGYWLVAGDGGIFTFGDAKYYGSTGAMHLNSPITQMIAGPGGKGYWLMATDGGVFTFGSAKFHGSMGAKRLNAPVIGMTATPDGGGYLLVASDGGVFTFGNAHFQGSTGGKHVGSPVIGIARTSTGGGYWIATRNGSVYNFGDAQRLGGAKKRLSPIRQVTQITSVPGTGGYRLLALPSPLMIAPPLGVGSTGAAVSEVQTRLLALGYWLPGVTGTYDSNTQQAVYAFQKITGLARTGAVDLLTHNRLNNAERPTPRSTSGYVVEIDKTRQVLIVSSGGHTSWIFNASSGSDHPYTSEGVGYSAHTPEGIFHVIRSVDGYDKSPLGQLYRPRYFTDTGIAVHGYTDVPPYPASHGCVRVSNSAIDFMWATNVLPIGATVWVYL